MIVAKSSDCVIAEADIDQNNEGAWKKELLIDTDFCSDTPDQIRTGVAGSKVLHD